MPPPAALRAQRCGFCGVVLIAAHGTAWRPAQTIEQPLADPHLPRLWVSGHRYVLLGRLARGDGSDVFRARRDARITEQVVVKILRNMVDADLLDREQGNLRALEASNASGSTHFAQLLPQRVDHGTARLGATGRDGERHVAVFRWRSGFIHTFEDVFEAHPNGVAPETAIWMYKRLLELLGWVHASGLVHGAVLPAHMLVHARDHGVMLVGWSCATTPGKALVATSKDARAYYADSAWNGSKVDPATDLAMGARVILRALGGEVDQAPASVPSPLARLLETQAREAPGAVMSAWSLKEKLDAVAREVFGPPRFVPFTMPGWS